LSSVDGDVLIADLGIRGVWSAQSEVLFDIRVSDTDAQSYLSYSHKTVLLRAETEKKQKYFAAALDHHAHFTPLYFSVDGLAGSEASCFIKCLASGLSLRWEKNCSEVLYWVRVALAFALLQATRVCIRGTRTKWRCLGFEDGAIISLNYNFAIVFVFVLLLFLLL